MADTVTPRLGLIKPEIGASADSWGNKLNINFDKLDLKIIQSTDQWAIALGDGNPASTTGHFIISRFNNSAIKVDDPFWINRQTGDVNVLHALNVGTINSPSLSMPYQSAPPANPPAGSASLYFDAQGNLYTIRPDGSTQYLGIPPGVISFTGAGTPDIGWAFLNGQAISRATNPVVFNRYGTIYGVGDGSTTFNLPDAKGRVFAHPDGGAGILVGFDLGVKGGEMKHQLTPAELANHLHPAYIYDPSHAHTYDRGTPGGPKPFSNGTTPLDGQQSTNTGGAYTGVRVWDGIALDRVAAAGGDQPHNNVQPTLALYAQVKLG